MLRAIRDAESRTRFLGYRVQDYKLWVFVLSAVLAGVAGALYVPQVGIINPSEFEPINSIEVVIWVAVGGRGTLWGAAAGAVLVNYAKTWFTGALPDVWLYALGRDVRRGHPVPAPRARRPAARPEPGRMTADPRRADPRPGDAGAAANRRDARRGKRADMWLYALGAMFVGATLFLPPRARRPAARPEPGRMTADPRRADPRHGDAGAAAASRRDAWRKKREAAARRQPSVLTGDVLYLQQVTVSFDGFKALDDLTLHVDPGELLCVIGPNGAGKTTMMDVVTGKTRPDAGRVFFGNQINLLTMNEPEIAQAGIGRKFQKPTVFDFLTVFENLELALAGEKSFWRTFFARLTSRDRERIDEALETTGLASKRGSPAGTLAHGQKQWLEIGMLLMQEPKLLLVDEPVAGMTPQETERTGELLLSLAGRHSVVVVEHDMEFVRSIARRVAVLHEGRVLAEGGMDAVQSDPRVIEVYLGA